MARFMEHLDYHLLRLREPMAPNLQYSFGRLLPVLNQIYGKSGFKAAFELARSGAEGGIYGVLKRVAQHLARQYAQNEIHARIRVYWNGLSIPEKHSAADEYLREFGHLLPEQLTEGSAVRVHADFPKVLEEHVHLLESLRQIRPR
jgi:hypothetical protein